LFLEVDDFELVADCYYEEKNFEQAKIYYLKCNEPSHCLCYIKAGKIVME